MEAGKVKAKELRSLTSSLQVHSISKTMSSNSQWSGLPLCRTILAVLQLIRPFLKKEEEKLILQELTWYHVAQKNGKSRQPSGLYEEFQVFLSILTTKFCVSIAPRRMLKAIYYSYQTLPKSRSNWNTALNTKKMNKSNALIRGHLLIFGDRALMDCT